MKKVFFAAAIILICGFIISCKKDSVDKPVIIDPLMDKLEAWFKFDQNFKDNAAKVGDGIPSGTVTFTADRKGNANGAIKFDGGSKLTLPGISRKTQITLCAWVKYDAAVGYGYFIAPLGEGPAFFQEGGKFGGAVSHPATNSVYGSPVDANWHHLAVSFDGTDIKFYVDGVLIGTKNHPGEITESPNDFIIGFINNFYWKGSLDDLRVYSKVLAVTDVQKLTGL